MDSTDEQIAENGQPSRRDLRQLASEAERAVDSLHAHAEPTQRPLTGDALDAVRDLREALEAADTVEGSS
jgi:hypothetical protein